MFWRLIRPFVFLALLITLVGTACLSSGGGGATQVPEKPTEESTTPTEKPSQPSDGKAVATLDDVQQATLQITAQGTSVDPEQGTQLNAGWSGTGFFISPDGLAVTNNHVVTGAAILKVYIGGDDTPHNARIVGTSECADLAVIKVEGSDFPYLEWYTGDVKVGMEVYSAGFPLSEPEYNLTKGIISKDKADGQTFWSSIDYVISHDATINPGNSGGPLVNSDGKVVGVNYRSRPDYNQYFAIGAKIARPVVDQLQEGKDVTSIGVNGEAFSFGANGEYPGIWVYSVETGSPADKSGVKPGDIILEMENILLATDGTYKDYCDVLRGHDADETMTLRVYRPMTDEILEGQLNGRELAVTGYGGLTSGAQGTTTNGGGTTTTVDSINTDFEADLTEEGWYEHARFVTEGEYSAVQKPGRVIITINKPDEGDYIFNDFFWDDDVVVTTQATKLKGPNRVFIAIACRASEAGWYEFNISTGGQWWIYKRDESVGNNGAFQILAKGLSNKIAVQNAPNVIEGSCVGTKLSLYVNGSKIGEATDRDFTEGQVGFGTFTSDIGNSQVEFEYFTAEPQ
jgi:S1-C subfamily serine protease